MLWTLPADYGRLPPLLLAFSKASLDMAHLFRSCRGVFRSGRWWLAVVLTLGLSGCKAWDTRKEGLRDNGLSQAARKARPEKQEKNIDYLGLSEKSRQVERDLSGQ